MTLVSRFRSPEAAQNFLAAYDTTLALWPVAHDEQVVDTRFGKTHVNCAGSPTAPPLLLIHGAQTSSTAWYANVGALSQHFRVVAPDVIDQAGKSVPARKLLNRQECADWLSDVLDALGIERATFVGHSHGGWQVLNLALLSPQRVERLVLLSPAGITRLKVETFLRLVPVFVMPTKRMFYWGFQWSTVKRLDFRQPEAVIDQMMVGGTSFKGQELGLGIVTTFSDEELRQIDKPALLLVGDQEKAFNAQQMIERARRLMPQVRTALIPHAAHLLPIDQPDAVNQQVLAFLTG
ncbi:MAG: alpha/beta hydrolase [Anaerolineae bacterium]